MLCVVMTSPQPTLRNGCWGAEMPKRSPQTSAHLSRIAGNQVRGGYDPLRQIEREVVIEVRGTNDPQVALCRALDARLISTHDVPDVVVQRWLSGQY